MGDNFAPPSGPPPPKVPAGWKAVWNDQYKEWFYVNIYTKKSQWDKPTEAVYGPDDSGAPAGPPPGYDHSNSRPTGPEKAGLGSSTADDEALARKLQSEEEARAGGAKDRGAADSYYQGGSGPSGPQGSNYYGSGGASGNAPPYGQSGSPYGQNQQPTQSGTDGQKRGFFSKLMGGGSSRPPQQGYGSGYPPQQGYGQQYPPQGYGGGYGQPQPGYYPPQGGYQQQPPKRHGGLGAGGGALLGAGAGILGGALLMDAIEDHDQAEYQQGFDQGMAADDGGDYGGGDDFGGDF